MGLLKTVTASLVTYNSNVKSAPVTNVVDYRVYKMSSVEKAWYILQAAAFLFVIGCIFFGNVPLALMMSLGSFWYPRYKIIELVKRRQQELNLQFRDCLYSLASALNVGLALENAFKAAYKDLQVIYCDDNIHILRELMLINRRLEINEPIEFCLADLAERSGLEDIRSFVDTVIICKRCGGNLVEVTKSSSNIIRDKIDICNEIKVSLSRQKYEQKILNIMPVVFIGLMKFGGGGYMDPLYSSFKGYLLMTAALMILGSSYIISQKIFNFKV